MRSQTIEVFPTTLKRYDVSDIINQQDVQHMIADIDDLHQNHSEWMQLDDLTVRYQCKPVLWHNDYPYLAKPHWQKLSQTYIDACGDYNRTVTNQIKNQDQIALTGVRAWFYKSNRESWQIRSNRTYHNHKPSYLSGVFYLYIPGDLTTGGTEFCDPRGPGMREMRNVEIQPMNLTWVIFPGWMDHAAGQADSDEWRYTIAADSYIKVL